MKKQLIVFITLLFLLLISCEKDETYNDSKNGFFVPTSFSPNGDGKNELFYPVLNKDILLDYQMKIFDKYSNRLFITNDISKGWNGQNSDNVVYPEDVYIYNLYFKFKDNSESEYSGSLRLIR